MDHHRRQSPNRRQQCRFFGAKRSLLQDNLILIGLLGLLFVIMILCGPDQKLHETQSPMKTKH